MHILCIRISTSLGGIVFTLTIIIMAIVMILAHKEVRNMRTFYKKNASVIDVLLAALVATFLVIGVIKVAQFVHQESPTCVVASVTAKQGDTLWGISEEHCPDHLRTGETVSIISEMNGGIGNIRVGQVINLPFKKGGN
jgi:uncharacterized membrane protein YoaK (UPF0700 family)